MFAAAEPPAADRRSRRQSQTSKIFEKNIQNFKGPKNREDSSDLDDSLIESIGALNSIIRNFFLGRFGRKTLRKFRENFAKPSSPHRRGGAERTNERTTAFDADLAEKITVRRPYH